MKRFANVLVAVLAAQSAIASAATFTVTLEADLIDLIPGNGFCSVLPQAGAGPCSLRAAVIEANALAGTDTIALQAGQVLQLALDGAAEDNAYTGDLDIRDDTLILFIASGERPIVDANGLERAFQVISGNLTLLGFDITGGDAPANGEAFGGAIYIGSGAGIVQLSLLRLYDNLADAGGGIYNNGDSTTVSSCEFRHNLVSTPNVVSGGAAIYNRGELDVDHSAIWDSVAEGDFPATAIINLTSDGRTLSIRNSVIAENRIGITNQQDSPLVLVNATLAGNSQIGLNLSGDGSQLQMRNTVIANNGTLDCVIADGATLNVDRYNMDSDNTCELASGTSNFPGVEPYLTPLRQRDGFTPASWPLTISPLIDSGHPVIGAIGCEADDQLFNERPVDFDGNGNARCDIGSIEMSSDVIFFDPIERY